MTWDDTLRPKADHGTNVGRAPYAGEALQWCRNDRQILPGIPTGKNNNNNNDDEYDDDDDDFGCNLGCNFVRPTLALGTADRFHPVEAAVLNHR